MREMKNAHKILIRTHKGKSSFGKPEIKSRNNITIHLHIRGYVGVGWTRMETSDALLLTW
jgi:hypothetical protein